MGFYLTVWVEFGFSADDSHLVNDLHNLYEKYGYKVNHINTNDNVTYEDAVKVNQECFMNRIDSKEHIHYRMVWDSGFTSFIITSPIIDIDENSNVEKYYSTRRREMILFPEDEITDEVFSRILEMVKDLYSMDIVYSVMIQKECQ